MNWKDVITWALVAVGGVGIGFNIGSCVEENKVCEPQCAPLNNTTKAGVCHCLVTAAQWRKMRRDAGVKAKQ